MSNQITDTPTGVPTILRLRDVSRQTGLSRSSIYQAMADGQFPRQLKLTARCVGWSAAAISEWVDSRIQGGKES
jgi:prophage regulatory protein